MGVDGYSRAVVTEAAPRRHRGADGITVRSVLLSSGLIIALAVIGFYVELAWMRVNLWGVPSLAPVLALVALGATAGVGARRRLGLTRREMLVIYAVLLTSSPLISHGMLFWMIPKVVHYYYLARAMPEWQTLFLPAIPTWFGPSQTAAVEDFFSGHARVPWDQWWLPLAAWSSFLLATIAAAGSVIAILQRQWINHERLSFPLAQIPLTLVGDRADGRAAGRLVSDRLFWLGASLAGAIAFLNGLAQRYPAIPSVPLGPVPIMLWQKVGPLAGLGEIDLVLWPWLIGLAFLIPAELSFSCWLFWLVRLGLTVLAIAAGHAPQLPEEWWESGFPAPYNQAGGAMLALGLWALWIARHHLRGVVRIALSRGAGADAAEPLPYRWALTVFAVSLTWMVYFLCLAGCRLVFAAALVLLILAFYVVWARLRAETGLGFLNMPFEYQAAMAMPTGSAALTTAEVITLHTVRWAYYPGEGSSFDVCTASQLEALKIADAAGLDRRRLFLLLAAAFVFSLAVSSYVLLTGIYRYGFLSLAMGGARGQTWPAAQPKFDGDRIVNLLTTPSPPDYAGLIGIAAGAAVAIFLGAMRLRFPWWPLHPLGYLASNVWGMMWFYMPFMVGWAAKVLVLRYGGLRLYRKAMPLAIGMIVGDMLNRGLWVVIALATQGRA